MLASTNQNIFKVEKKYFSFTFQCLFLWSIYWSVIALFHVFLSVNSVNQLLFQRDVLD